MEASIGGHQSGDGEKLAMRLWNLITTRLRSLILRNRVEEELDEELRLHVELEVERKIAGGMTEAQARRETLREFGALDQMKEDCRDARGLGAIENLLRDARYALRRLRRDWRFTAAAMLMLALGIGATTAVFSIADTVFLRPLPYKNADRLMWVGVQFRGFAFVPSPDYIAWRRDNRTFDALGATQASATTSMLLGGVDPTQVHAGKVSANFLDVFTVKPALGRSFRPEEELPNGPKAALLTDRFWREHFHADRSVVGAPLTLDGKPYTVIGVLPASFSYPIDVEIDLLTTLPIESTAGHRDRVIMTWQVFGRLKANVSMQAARDDLERLFAASKADFPQMFRGDSRLVFQTLQEHRAGNVRTLLFLLMAAAGCLLAIACANVANLLLARWSAWGRELAVRAALGAGRERLAGELLTEILLLVAMSTAAALAIAVAGIRGFVYFAANSLPRLSEASPDIRVFSIALLMSLVTALAFGGLPLLRARGINVQAVLQKAARTGISGGQRHLRRALVAVEVGLSVILLAGAALLLETLWHMQHDHLGFLPEHLVTISVPLPSGLVDAVQRKMLIEEILNLVRRTPGTEAIAQTQCTPLFMGVGSSTFTRSDRPKPEAFHLGDGIGICAAGEGYLDAVGAQLKRGRFFQSTDAPGTAAVINETAARKYFPGEDPLGKQILGNVGMGPWKTVVGVVGDTKNQGLNMPALPHALLNDDLGPGEEESGPLLFVVRTVAGEAEVARVLREEMRANHPGLFVRFQTLDEAIEELSTSPRFNTVLLATFAAIAFLMAIAGVYGVLAFSVAQRRAEIGIRMALGASQQSVIGLVMKDGAGPVAVGVAAGLAGALLSGRALSSFLYGVGVADPATYVGVVAVLVLAAALASFVPARKAAALDPGMMLRHE